MLAAGLLLASPASAAQVTPTAIEASWLQLEGDATAVQYRGPTAGDRLQLVADAVHMEADAAGFFEVGQTAFGTQTPHTIPGDFGATTWSLSSRTNSSTFHLIGHGARLEAGSGSARFSAPDAPCLQQPKHFPSEYPSPCTPLDSSVMAIANSAEWRVTGNFTLALWGWDGAIRQEPRQEVWSGSRPTARHQSIAQQEVGEIEVRQVHLNVTNGTLRLLPAGPASVKAALTSAAFIAATLQATTELDDLEGALFTLSRDGNQVRANAVPPPPLLPSPVRQAGLAGGAAALVLVAWPAVAFARRRTHLGRLRLAHRNLGIGNPQAAARHAWRVRHAAYLVEASVIGAVAAIKAGRLGMAQRFLDRLHAAPRHDEATCTFLRAQLLVQRGDREGGERLLEDCLALDGSFQAEAAANPVLAPHLDPSRWPAAPGVSA